MRTPARAFLGLGSNRGDRLAMLRQAAARLRALPGVRILRASSVYETAPLGLTDQPWFLNQVLEVETTLDPHHLLAAVQEVEVSLGRRREVRWGPRTIDIDILLYADVTLRSPRLVLPHPALAHRRFVLMPLAELDPLLRLPDGRCVHDLLEALGDAQVVRRLTA